MQAIPRGDLILAGPWNDGALPMSDLEVHRFSHREDGGLAVTLCGLRQESRSNGWSRALPERFSDCECADCERIFTA